MNQYTLTVWTEEDEPFMESLLTLDEEVDKDVLNVVASSMRTAFEILVNRNCYIQIKKC